MLICRQCGELFLDNTELAAHLVQETLCRDSELTELLIEHEMRRKELVHVETGSEQGVVEGQAAEGIDEKANATVSASGSMQERGNTKP